MAAPASFGSVVRCVLLWLVRRYDVQSRHLGRHNFNVLLIRRATADDAPFLRQMLAVAADWRPQTRLRSIAELMAVPDLAHYVADWPKDGRNGPTEAVSNLVRRIKHIAFGVDQFKVLPGSERCLTPKNPTWHSSTGLFPPGNPKRRFTAQRSGDLR